MVIQDYRTSPSTLIFYGEADNDLSLMPTTVKAGQGEYADYGCAPAGSIARILTSSELKIYMLRSTGWIKINDNI